MTANPPAADSQEVSSTNQMAKRMEELGLASSSEPRSLNKIRDILFGNHAREQQARLEQLEERLLAECTGIRQEMGQRLEALEGFVKKELATLTDRLRAEGSARDELEETQTAALQETVKTLNKKIAALKEQLGDVQRELREEILSQAKSLLDEQRRGSEAFSASLARETNAIRGNKLDKGELAAMFNDIAVRLSGEEEA